MCIAMNLYQDTDIWHNHRGIEPSEQTLHQIFIDMLLSPSIEKEPQIQVVRVCLSMCVFYVRQKDAQVTVIEQ